MARSESGAAMNGPIVPPSSSSCRLRRAAAAAASGDANAAASVLLGRHPDTFSVNTTLKALSLSPFPSRALPFFFRMLASGFSPNAFTFPPVAASAARSPDLTAGEVIHGQALKRGAAPASVHASNALISMYSACGLACAARSLFDETARDVVSWNAMLAGYARLGDIPAARRLFEEMPQRNSVSWNAMIGGCLRARRPQHVLMLFRDMLRSGPDPTLVTLVTVATACGRLGALREGAAVHGHYMRSFSEGSLVLQTALLDMYCRCGRVRAAETVFRGIPKRNLVCWNAMIRGHCIHGSPYRGFALFQELISSGDESAGISPDEVTFIAILCACARAGLLEEGKRYFKQMTSIYKLKPTFAHYWCIANLYGSLGFIREAVEVLQGIPEESEPLIWSGLLGICRFHGDLELGERIAKRLMELEPSNISGYRLLQNLYVAAYRWEDAQKVKALAKERGLRLNPGHRLVDLNEIVHNFKIGDRVRPEIHQIYTMMDELASRIKSATLENRIPSPSSSSSSSFSSSSS